MNGTSADFCSCVSNTNFAPSKFLHVAVNCFIMPCSSTVSDSFSLPEMLRLVVPGRTLRGLCLMSVKYLPTLVPSRIANPRAVQEECVWHSGMVVPLFWSPKYWFSAAKCASPAALPGAATIFTCFDTNSGRVHTERTLQ